ncbi:MAG: fused MFS/spermidine synthase [Bacteroidota bacterium]|nr:fused MFS/spermidine synthase [Bacteroidota bacterium]
MKQQESYKISLFMLLLFAFCEGAAVMVLELIGGRMIAPVYGSSLIVWTTVLGITMSALALGYFIGGNIAIKKNVLNQLYLLFFSAATLILIMPKVASIAIDLIYFDSLFISVFIASLLLLFLPVAILGATTPILVKLVFNHGISQGKSSGHVYGASTIGGIIFTFLVGFWLVPDYGLSTTGFIIGVGISILPTYYLIKSISLKYALIPVIFIVLGLTLNYSNDKVKGVKVIHQSEGLLGQLLVVDQPKSNGANGFERIMYVNRMGQTWIDLNTGNSIWSYPNYITVLASSLKEKPDVLILGIGGGTLANLLINVLGANIETVELDERIGKIASRNFNMNKQVNLNIDDARHFIKTSKKKYDLIIFDVFKGEVPPSHVLTVECFQEAKNNLKEDGFMIINFNGFVNGPKGKAGRAVIKTILASGFHVNIFPTVGNEEDRNILYTASPKKRTFDQTRINLNLYNKAVNIDTMQLNLDNIKFKPDDQPLTDNYPVLELLNLEAAQAWRKSYNENHTKKYKDKGLPIFK